MKKKYLKPIYVALGTTNQFNSFKSIIESLVANRDKFFISVNKNVIPKNYYFNNVKLVKFNIKIILEAIIFSLCNSLILN